jgi:hypothetical protein
MNYLSLYSKLIRNAQKEKILRKLAKKNGKYYEKHHVIPKCEQLCGELNGFYNKCHTIETKSIIGNMNANTYRITFKDGHEEIVFNLKAWCRLNNHRSASLFALCKGTIKSYKNITKVEKLP